MDELLANSPRRRRPRQARDRRLGPPRARTDPGDGGRRPGVLRGGRARERAPAGRGRGGAGRLAAPVDRPGHQRVAAERRPSISWTRRAQASSAAARRPWRSPSRAASRRDPRWRCCPWRPAAPGSRRARRSSTRSCRRRPPARRARSRGPDRVCCGSARSARWPAPSARARAAEELPHLARVGHPCRVAEGDLLSARVAQAGGDLEHALGRDVSLVGAAEGGRDHPLASQPRRARPREHRSRPGQRLGDRAVDVLAVVGLRRRQEDVDLVEGAACRLRAGPSRSSSAASRPRSLGISTDTLTSGGTSIPPAPQRRRRAGG